MINKIQTKLYYLSLSIFIILIDQYTKYLIFYNYKKFINIDFLLFRLDIVKNYGAAFSLLTNETIILKYISLIASLIFAINIYSSKHKSNNLN